MHLMTLFEKSSFLRPNSLQRSPTALLYMIFYKASHLFWPGELINLKVY